jgi:perosamine synthetase
LGDDERLMVPFEADGCNMNWFVFVVRLAEEYSRQQRDNVLDGMREAGIHVSNYFSPVHLQPFMVEEFGFKEGDFPVTESVSNRTIALPFYNNLRREEVGIVCGQLTEMLDKI